LTLIPLNHIIVLPFYHDWEVGTTEPSDNRADYLAQRRQLDVIKDAAAAAADGSG